MFDSQSMINSKRIQNLCHFFVSFYDKIDEYFLNVLKIKSGVELCVPKLGFFSA